VELAGLVLSQQERRKPSLVVAALAPVLRWKPGRNSGDNGDTTRHLTGRSVRVLAFGLAFVFSASRMTTREHGAGKTSRFGPFLDTIDFYAVFVCFYSFDRLD
jgi:hypothetical protein